MLVGGGQTQEVKNKQGYKILAQNYMQLGHLEYEKLKGATLNRWELMKENEFDHGWRGS